MLRGGDSGTLGEGNDPISSKESTGTNWKENSNADPTNLPQKQSAARSSTAKTFLMRCNFISYLVKILLSNFVKDPDMLHTLTTIVSSIAWTYVVLSALGTAGFDTKPILSLLGIGGLTLGFSLKDVLTDCYAGMFVQFTRPFQRGDTVEINGFKGKVISTNIRHVKLLNSAENVEILIPLSIVYKSEIKIERAELQRWR